MEKGESVIQVPNDRKSEIEPVVAPKYQFRSLFIKFLAISLYAKVISASDSESEMQSLSLTLCK